MRALEEAGFQALGCDIACPPVEFLKTQGYRAYVGSVDDEYPEDWPEPAVVTNFFVIHHVEDPVKFLQSLRSRFPRSTLMIAEYFDKGVNLRLPQCRPPRTLSVWNTESLKLALEKAGYRSVTVGPTRFLPSEVPMRGVQQLGVRLDRFLPSRAYWAYYLVKRLVFWPYSLWLRLRRRSFVVLGVAEPQ
jgi:hypothetical protein